MGSSETARILGKVVVSMRGILLSRLAGRSALTLSAAICSCRLWIWGKVLDELSLCAYCVSSGEVAVEIVNALPDIGVGLNSLQTGC